MTNHERLADVAFGVSWMGFFTSIVAQALPILQGLAAIAAVIASFFAARYYNSRTRKSED
jgi:hypothetical protein